MAKLSKDEFFDKLHGLFAEDSSDDAIKIIEDFSDTYIELEKQAMGDGEDWQAKYNANDEAWRKKYYERFFSGGNIAVPNSLNTDEEKETFNAEISIDDLFEKE